jgi:hypothetical protein
MKKLAMFALGILTISGLAMAEDYHQAHGEYQGYDHAACLNNVVSVDADGNKTALCGCGMEFKVSDKTPSMNVDGMTVYACSDGCAATMSGMDKKMMDGKIGELKMAVAENKGLATNAAMMDGKMTATCPCGMSVEVNDKTPFVVENGVKVYTCCDDCLNSFSSADVKIREDAEMKARKMHMSK